MTKPTLSVDKSDRFDRFQADLNSELLQSRTLIVGPTLDEKNYNLVIAQLIFLQQRVGHLRCDRILTLRCSDLLCWQSDRGECCPLGFR
jgi:hypothetical protein